MLNRKRSKVIAFLIMSFFIGLGTSFAENEVVVNDVNYSGSYPSEEISVTITTENIYIEGIPELKLERDNPEAEHKIKAEIKSCSPNDQCIGKITYDKELPTGKYTGKIIFTYKIRDDSKQYTATGSYTLYIIQPDLDEDGVFVKDIVFNDVIAGYKHKKIQPVLIRSNTNKTVFITSASVKSDVPNRESMFTWQLESNDHGILKYDGTLNAGKTGEIIIGYGEEPNQETNQITGLIIINVISIDASDITGTNIDFGQIKRGYEDVNEQVITVINPTNSNIEIKEIKLDISDNPNINDVFEISNSETNFTLYSQETADIATINMKQGLNVGLYTGKVEITYKKENDENEYKIRSYLTGSVIGIQYTDNVVTYVDTNGKEFSMGTITIGNGTNSITMLDRNLGATTNDINKEGSYGYYFQRGNSHGFSLEDDEAIVDGSTTGFPDTSSYSRNNPYISGTFISDKDGIKYGNWSDIGNDNLRGGDTDYKKQGPCPAGYHIPTSGERLKLVELYWKIFPGEYPIDEESIPGKHVIWDDLFITDFQNRLKIPLAGHRDYYGDTGKFGLYSYLWSSSAKDDYPSSYAFGLSPMYLVTDDDNIRGDAQSIRCFKDMETDDVVVLNYDTRGGTKIQSQTLAEGDNGYVPYIPEKDGTEFLGWYSNSTLSTDWDNNIVDKDTTIYAKWSDDIKPEPAPSTPSYSGGGGHRSHTTVIEDNDEDEEIVEDTEENNEEVNDTENKKIYSDEMEQAYEWAYKNGITTMDTIQKAELDQPLTRIAMAKMLSQYAMNVLGKVPANKMAPRFDDVTTELNEEYYGGSELAYQLNIMGLNMPDNKFRPFGLVTRAEFGTALSRLLYGLEDGEGAYYETHLNKLKNEGIITNDNPDLEEARGYIMLMLMRADNK